MRIGGIEAGGTKMVCAIGEVQTDKGQPGENQVTFELRPANGNPQGVHHVAFRQSRPEDVEVLKEQGIVFKTEHATIKDTGRTVSSFPDPNGIMWQLTD